MTKGITTSQTNKANKLQQDAPQKRTPMFMASAAGMAYIKPRGKRVSLKGLIQQVITHGANARGGGKCPQQALQTGMPPNPLLKPPALQDSFASLH